MNRPELDGGILFVISAPSGTGKSSAARKLVEQVEGLDFSVSCTTRAPRPGERDGREYHFVHPDRFQEMVEEGAFLEWANVFGNCYGTGVENTRRALARGGDLLLDIDVQGARQVRRSEIDTVSVILLPPRYDDLEQRLRGRGSEAPDQRESRLASARREALDHPQFDYMVINENLDRTVEELAAIVHAERRRTRRRSAEAERILKTFPS